MNIIIRTDASLQIGSGHVMRCLTLADELKKNGANVAFICRKIQGDMCDFITSKGYLVHQLQETDKAYQQLDDLSFLKDEKNQLKDAQSSLDCLSLTADWLIIDHYSLDISWERVLRERVKKIMVIDDLADRPHDCDVLLDQNYFADLTVRYTDLVPKQCLKLLGPKYALLRPEFIQAEKKLLKLKSGAIQRIFIFFGGSDLTGETVKTLKAISLINRPDIAVDVVVGVSNSHGDEISVISSQLSQVNLYHQINNMAELMSHADLAIGAGGTTSWERAALGLPSIVLGIADNQREIIKDMSKDGLIIGFAHADSVSVDDLAQVLNFVIMQQGLMKFLSSQSLKLVDTKGTERIANTLLPHDVKLRVATKGDSDNVFSWRNSQEVRESSHNSSYISLSNHSQWLTKTLADDNKILLIGECNNKAIGVIRYDLTEQLALVSIYLTPGMHGMGYGTNLLIEGEQWLKQYYPQIKSIEAEVKQTNQVSMALFSKANYQPSPTCFQKTIK